MRALLSNRYLWSLTLGHFTIDLYSGVIPILLYYLSVKLSLSLEQVGTAAALYSLCSSLSQPIFGYLADRFGGRWLASGGLVWMSVLQGMVGFVPDLTSLLILAPLAGFGSAAFHPPSASAANRTSGQYKSGGMAIFLLGGNSGFAVGPLVASLVIGSLGLSGTALIAVVGVIIAPILFILSSRHQPLRATTAAKSDRAPAGPSAERTASRAGGRRIEFNRAFTGVAILALVTLMMLRAWSQSSTTLYVPQFFTSVRGMTIAEASQLAFVFAAVLALGSLLGGFLSDRIGGRTVMVVSFLLAAPASFALFGTESVNVYLSAAVLGLATGAAWPPTLVMAQELFPRHAGVASGLALGFVFGMGGLGNYITGYLAERITLFNAMMLLSGLPLLAVLCAFVLPTHRAVASAAREARRSMETTIEPVAPMPAASKAAGR